MDQVTHSPTASSNEMESTMNVGQRAMQWVMSRDTGTSSKTIWAVMQMVEPDYFGTPADPDDFGRCYRLLKLIPEWRENLRLVAYHYPAWAPLIREWDALTAMFEEGERTHWKPPYVMWERMQALNDEGLILCGWKMTAPGCGSGPKRDHKVAHEAIDKALTADSPRA